MDKHPGIGKNLLAAEHQTNYLEEGSGKPLFLLHGSGPGVSAWTNWGKVMPELSSHFRVIAPDIAGFGFTEFKADSKYDIKLWVRHLTGIMDALGIDKASFVGNSFGGALSIGLALFAPSGWTSWCSLAPRPVSSCRPRACVRPGSTSRPWKTWKRPCVSSRSTRTSSPRR